MAYYNIKEVWTPLKLIGLKFYKTPDHDGGHMFIKFGKGKRKMIR